MFAVIAYDIMMDDAGVRRYQKIYKLCIGSGYHVNNSVFEFDMPYSSLLRLIKSIEKLINPSCDSVRVYFLGKRTESNSLILGVRKKVEMTDETFII